MIKREWVKRYDSLPDRTSATVVLQSWDTASKDGEQNDWSVCTTWYVQDGRYYLADELRGRFDYPTLKERAVAYARMRRPTKILIEDAGVGTALVAELKTCGSTVIAVKADENKKTRMSVQSAKFASGQVVFPRQAPWLEDLEADALRVSPLAFRRSGGQRQPGPGTSNPGAWLEQKERREFEEGHRGDGQGQPLRLSRGPAVVKSNGLSRPASDFGTGPMKGCWRRSIAATCPAGRISRADPWRRCLGPKFLAYFEFVLGDSGGPHLLGRPLTYADVAVPDRCRPALCLPEGDAAAGKEGAARGVIARPRRAAPAHPPLQNLVLDLPFILTRKRLGFHSLFPQSELLKARHGRSKKPLRPGPWGYSI
jgi:predicted phage terminase large subunit-like protein